MTYLAAAPTLVGASTYNKNSQLSFVLGPKFFCTYTTFGNVKRLEEVMIWKGLEMGRVQPGANGLM